MTDTIHIPDASYPDNGCVHNPVPKGCLNCPFPRCWHDDPEAFGMHSFKGSSKRLEIAKLTERGLHYTEMVELMNLSERSVLRYLAKQKLVPAKAGGATIASSLSHSLPHA